MTHDYAAALNPDLSYLEALEATPVPIWRAYRRVEWRHYRALLDQGIPARDLARDGIFTFGVVTIQGREMLVTENARLRAYLCGPGLFAMPGNLARGGTNNSSRFRRKRVHCSRGGQE